MGYDYEHTVEYDSDRGYRENLRCVFKMNKESIRKKIEDMRDKIEENLDDETIDEVGFDEDASNKAMNDVFERTKNNKGFQEMYKLAAGKMISVDMEIGLAVCFSYDYFMYFHRCLKEYLDNGEGIKDPNCFKEMIQRLK